eukprot:6456467-Amphidinium_carterae.1
MKGASATESKDGDAVEQEGLKQQISKLEKRLAEFSDGPIYELMKNAATECSQASSAKANSGNPSRFVMP